MCQQNNILFPVQIIKPFCVFVLFCLFFGVCVCVVCSFLLLLFLCLFRDHTKVRLFCYFVFVCVFLALKSD